jgi:hypothetical protein
MSEYITRTEFNEYKRSMDDRLGGSGKIKVIRRKSKTRDPDKPKRQPSEYNIFMKSEVPRVKKKNPSLSHTEAFTTAARGWSKNKK